MKKILVISLVMLFTSKMANAQSFPDSGFENIGTTWVEKTSAKGKYWDFHLNYILGTLNLLYGLPNDLGDAPLTAFREVAKTHGGNYAIKTVSNSMVATEEGSIFLPGVVATIYIDIAEPDDDWIVVLGKPYTHKPTSLHGFMQYAPVNGDSAAIEIQLTQYNDQTNKHTIIGRGRQVFTSEIDDWTEFNVEIEYSNPTATPNSVILIFSASAAYDFTNFETLLKCKGQVGSALYIDDIEFDFAGVGVKEALMSKVKMNVYPNPSSDKILINIEQHTNGLVLIYDNMGRKVGEHVINGVQQSIDVYDYAAGSYLINIIENGKVITSGRFVKE